MKNEKFIKSNVVFNEEEHTYTLNGKKLQGITKVINEKLFADKYKDVSEKVLQNAANKGKSVHSEIEMYENAGLESESPEFKAYLNILKQQNLKSVASEYIVTDGEMYASPIDCVLMHNDTLILADIKTTYELDLEYVAWQLSVYAYLFEKQNPEIKVDRLAVIWLRPDKSAYKEVHRYSTKDVEALLYDPTFDYSKQEAIINNENDVEKLADIINQINALTAQKDEITNKLFKQLEVSKIKSLRYPNISVTYKDGAERETFDSKRFKADAPELYCKYIKTSITKASLMIKVK